MKMTNPKGIEKLKIERKIEKTERIVTEKIRKKERKTEIEKIELAREIELEELENLEIDLEKLERLKEKQK